MGFEVINGDCLVEMPGLISRGVKVQLCAADIPYFEVKDEAWDNQWKDEKDYLAWVDACLGYAKQLIAPNGSLYLFASPQMGRKVGNVVAEHFNILTDIRWRKPPFSTKAEMFRKEDLRAYFPASETIFFCEQYGSDEQADGEAGYAAAGVALNRQLFGDAIRRAMVETGTTTHELTESVGAYGKVNHGGSASNWINGFNAPTQAQFVKIWTYLGSKGATLPGIDYSSLQKEHGDRRADQESLKLRYENLRRPFNATPDQPYTDVWDFPTVNTYPGKHPCEKPLAMTNHIVAVSSRPGDTVLDFTAGSCNLGVSCVMQRRDFIGIDSDAHWCAVGEAKMKRASGIGATIPKRIIADRPAPLFDTQPAGALSGGYGD